MGDDRDRASYDLLYRLLSAWLRHGEARPEEWAAADFGGLFRIADRHSLSAAACAALEDTGLMAVCPADIAGRFREAMGNSVRRTILMDAERERLLAFLEKEGIRYMPLKGVILKDCYPRFGVRQMADNDILFDAAGRKTVRRYFEENGFRADISGRAHDSYRRPPVYNFEMHRCLFTGYNAGKDQSVFARYYSDIRAMAVKDAGNGCGFHLSDEDFYVYFLAHAYKHASVYGTGIRTLLDIFLYRSRKEPMDEGYIAGELEKLQIRDFEECCRALAGKLFGTPPEARAEGVPVGKVMAGQPRTEKVPEEAPVDKAVAEQFRADKVPEEGIAAEQSRAEKVPEESIVTGQSRAEGVPEESIVVGRSRAERIPEESIVTGQPRAEKVPKEGIVAEQFQAEGVLVESAAAERSRAEKVLKESIVAGRSRAESVPEESIVTGQPRAEGVPVESIAAGRSRAERVPEENIVMGQPRAEKVLEESIMAEQFQAEGVLVESAAAERSRAEKVLKESIVAGRSRAESVPEENIVMGQSRAEKVPVESIAAGRSRAKRVPEESTVAGRLRTEKIQEERLLSEQPQMEKAPKEGIAAGRSRAESVPEESIVTGQPRAEEVPKESIVTGQPRAEEVPKESIAAGRPRAEDSPEERPLSEQPRAGEPIGGSTLTPRERDMLERMEAAGTYGTTANRVRDEMRAIQGDGEPLKRQTKFRYLFRKIFPGIAWYRANTPFACRHRWALPFCWLYRVFLCVFADGKHNIQKLRVAFTCPEESP